MGYKQGENRQQISLLPEAIDDYVGENSVVRFIDGFVDSLNLRALGFTRTSTAETGAPAYSAACLLKLYLYGYLHQHRSSRQLERQARVNIELIWLMEKLTPVYKTIADFRKDNGKAIGAAVGEFRSFCRELGLYGQQLVAIDGSFFKASNGQDKVLSEKRLRQEAANLEREVEKYLEEMDRLDAEESDEVELTAEELEEKIRIMKERLKEKESQRESLSESDEAYRCLSDGDARLLCKGGGTVIGYNVQIAVDDKHHLIAGYDVTNDGNDAQQLGRMALQARDNMAVDSLEVVADSGYHTRAELKKCADAQITAYVAFRDTSSSKAQGRFGKQDFVYDEAEDIYRCPAGETLKRVGQRKSSAGLLLHTYRAKSCRECAIRDRCIKPETRTKQLDRWEHEQLVEENAVRLKANPAMMSRRKGLAEHPFGTFKRWSGQEHFLTRGMANVGTEMSLSVLAYNLKRAVQVKGVKALIQALPKQPVVA